MKRFLLIVMVSCLLMSCAAAESIDLSGLSFDQLVSLREKINLAIWNSKEWQAVTVPQGIWVVGEDIPAGKWVIRCSSDHIDSYSMAYTRIAWGSSFDSKSNSIPTKSRYGSALIYHKNGKGYGGETTEIILDLSVGDCVEIYDDHNKAVFFPYTGKPDLGFK